MQLAVLLTIKLFMWLFRDESLSCLFMVLKSTRCCPRVVDERTNTSITLVGNN